MEFINIKQVIGGVFMSKKYFACVYGGASEKIDKKYKKEIEKLGKIIAENNFSLVYGAGNSGCMGAVARGVRENNGYIMGISPRFIKNFEGIFDCDNNVLVDTMSERKTLMEKHADIFIIVPGGVGTMDEFFQVLTLKYLKRINTPIIILNIDSFYDKLLSLIDSLIEQNATDAVIHELFEVIDSVDDKRLKSILMKIKNT